MTLIKVCGITSVPDALAAASLGADIIGLVFAESTRRVSLQQAMEICLALKKLPYRPCIAGVFVNENPDSLNNLALKLGLDIVQLSGDESAVYCQDILCPVIKVVHVDNCVTADQIAETIRHIRQVNIGWQIITMLDSKIHNKYGGTGQAFNHSLAKQLCSTEPVMIAGGLGPANVAGLVRDIRPMGVDVSSGVETGGSKDVAKIHAFIQAVRSVDPDMQNPCLMKNIFTKGEQNVTR
jgi:phosphoribosylanthranilate isomerase